MTLLKKNFLLSLFFFLTIFTMFTMTSAYGLEVGKPAPNIQGQWIDGKNFSLSSMKNNVVIVSFWASWCGPCQEEMPVLETYYQKYRAKGLNIIAISMDKPSEDETVRQIMHRYSYLAAFNRNVSYRDYGRIWRIPMIFVIDRQGILRMDGSEEAVKMDLPALEKIVTPLLLQ